MSQTRPKKQITPLNADTFNLIPDIATLADTSGVIVPVANQAEGDSIATALSAAGYPVTDARPLFVYNAATGKQEFKNTSGWHDFSTPMGLQQKRRVTSAGASWGTSITVIDNFASQTFVAGRHYRIGWDLENYGASQSGTYWSAAINTCATSDPAAQTTGLTPLGGYTIHTVDAAYGQSAMIECYYDASSTTSLQIKFTGQVVVKTGANMSSYVIFIEDLGAQF